MSNGNWAANANYMTDDELEVALGLVRKQYHYHKDKVGYWYDVVATLQAEYDHRAANR